MFSRFQGNRAALALATGALAVGLAGCGGTSENAPAAGATSTDAGSASPAQPQQLSAVLVSSVDSAQKASTAKVSMSMTIRSGGQGMPIESQGVVDNAAGRTRMLSTMQIPGSAAMKFTTVTDGSTVYLNGIPGMPPGKWMKQEMGAAAAAPSSSDPLSSLQLLRNVSDEVQEKGTAVVRGKTTKRYRAVVNVDKALDTVKGSQVEASRRALRAAGVTSIPVEIFVDDQGLPARITQKFSMKVQGTESSVDMRMDMYDWGSPVTISVPAASDVVKAPSPSA